MRLAIPCEGDQVCEHFGRASQFMFVDADLASGRIEREETLTPPPHEPGLWPKWVADQGADVVLAVGMGGRAVQRFAEHGVDVVVGVMLRDPRQAVQDYLGGMLESSGNVCDQSGRGGRCR